MEVYDALSHYYPSDAMSLDELSYWITFNRVSGIGPVSFKSLLDYFDNDLQAAWRADTKELAQAGLTRNTIENVITLRKTSTPQRELEKLEKLRIRVITWKDKTYPPLLREIDDSPPVLYSIRKCEQMLASNLHGQSARNNHHAPYSYVFPIRAKLRWPLSLGQEAVGTTWYVALFLAYDVYSRLLATCLATCPYRVWQPVTRLLTRTFEVLEHVRGQMHPRCLCTYSLKAIAKRKSRTLQWM